jgi:hypothetical protein
MYGIYYSSFSLFFASILLSSLPLLPPQIIDQSLGSGIMGTLHLGIQLVAVPESFQGGAGREHDGGYDYTPCPVRYLAGAGRGRNSRASMDAGMWGKGTRVGATLDREDFVIAMDM